MIEEALQQGINPRDLLTDLVWPTMEMLQGMYRDDRITITQLNLATRLNRSITDQLTCLLPARPIMARPFSSSAATMSPRNSAARSALIFLSHGDTQSVSRGVAFPTMRC